MFQLDNNVNSWWKIEDKQGQGDAITLIDDGMEHKVEVYIRISERTVKNAVLPDQGSQQINRL